MCGLRFCHICLALLTKGCLLPKYSNSSSTSSSIVSIVIDKGLLAAEVSKYSNCIALRRFVVCIEMNLSVYLSIDK